MRRIGIYAVIIIMGFAVSAHAMSSKEPPPTDEGPRLTAKDAQYFWVFKESVALGVPEAELATIVAGCRAQGFTSAEIRRVLGLVAKAKLAGLPHEDILLKLKEGLAKKASPELINNAMTEKAQTLRRAKSLVDTLLMEGFVSNDYELAITMVGDSLEAGMRPQQVLTMIRGGKEAPEGSPDTGGIFKNYAPGK